MKYCPCCGGQRLEDAGTVFIEDGPYDGGAYANEGDYARYRCQDCQRTFGPMPEPVTCSKCGVPVGGDVGTDCGERDGAFLCDEHMDGEIS